MVFIQYNTSHSMVIFQSGKNMIIMTKKGISSGVYQSRVVTHLIEARSKIVLSLTGDKTGYDLDVYSKGFKSLDLTRSDFKTWLYHDSHLLVRA